jgi:hypothetical protein
LSAPAADAQVAPDSDRAVDLYNRRIATCGGRGV